MRARVLWRSLTALTAVSMVLGCGKSPAAPDGSLQIPTGSLLLRVTFQSACARSELGSGRLPLVYSRVNVSRVGSEWIGTAASPAAGDVELRFSLVPMPIAEAQIQGVIKGQAIHMPELVALPPWDSRVNFGSDGRTVITGVVFSVTTPSNGTAIDGIGTGAITLSDSTGQECSGMSFSWSLSPTT